MKRANIPTAIINALANMQDGLNELIDVNWRQTRSLEDWTLAITMESTELIDSYPWKWWKNTSASPDINNVRVELVDILHFALSGTMQLHASGKPPREIPADVQHNVSTPLTETANAIGTFRGIIYLAKDYHFGKITEMIIQSAEDLDFNLVGYYVAKHTLNYIRQLGGYKSGSYTKVKHGVEDNVLLHECIAAVPPDDVLASDKYREGWSKIMSLVYDAFEVPPADRRSTDYWLK